MAMRREQVAAALKYLQDKADLRGRLQRATSLDPQEQDLADIAVETGASFIPGVGQALAARDVERARRADDPAGMAMASMGAIPGGRLAGLLKRYDPTRAEIFIGKTAKTWDAPAAQKAQELEKVGFTPEAIWRKTGTFRGPEGEWRQEISDAMAFKPTVGTPEANTRFWNVNEAVLHPAMRKAYPEIMEETLTTIERKPFAESGFYQAKVPRTDEAVGLDPELYVAARDRGSIKSILAHELQHAVQEAEGFARGGSPRMFEKGVALSERGRGVLEDLRDSLGSGSLTSPREIVDNLKYFREGELERIAAKHKFKTVDELQKFLKEETLQRDPVEQYKRLAGEAEARATQARRGMTMEQRRTKFPYESYDVPIEELIIRR
jgi:hypothetical protein